MIRQRLIAARYADAFMKYTAESIGGEKALLDIKALREIMRQDNGFKECLENPEISFVDKCAVIDKILSDGFSVEIKHFLKLLLESKRISHFWDIAEFIRIKYGNQGDAEAVLKTTFPLDLDLIKRIQDKIEKKFQQKFKFYIELDSRLLGGIQVVIGNQIIDGSIKRQIENLKETLMAVQVN